MSLLIVVDGDMEEWDQETLEKVVESKKNEYNQNKPTDIVSLFLFLFASQNLLLLATFWDVFINNSSGLVSH